MRYEVNQDGSAYRYDVVDQNGDVLHYGFRPSEAEAKRAGFEDKQLLSQFHRSAISG